MASAKIKREKDFDHGVVTFTSTESGNTFAARLADLQGCNQKMIDDLPDILRRIAVHGLNAKAGDSAASSGDVVDVQTTHEQLCNGVWSARGEGESGPRVTLLAEALAQVTGQELPAVVAKLADMSDEQKKELRKHEQVDAAMKGITAKRAAEKAKQARKSAGEAAPLQF